MADTDMIYVHIGTQPAVAFVPHNYGDSAARTHGLPNNKLAREIATEYAEAAREYGEGMDGYRMFGFWRVKGSK